MPTLKKGLDRFEYFSKLVFFFLKLSGIFLKILYYLFVLVGYIIDTREEKLKQNMMNIETNLGYIFANLVGGVEVKHSIY